jgi:hypothetical protein
MTDIQIAVACRNASGMADMPIFTVTATEAEYALGVHYDKAASLAQEAGYEAPFLCFDASEQDALAAAVLELGLMSGTTDRNAGRQSVWD